MRKTYTYLLFEFCCFCICIVVACSLLNVINEAKHNNNFVISCAVTFI